MSIRDFWLLFASGLGGLAIFATVLAIAATS